MPRAVLCAVLVAATAAPLGGHSDENSLKLRMIDGHPIVDGVFVNGHGPYRFLVDTGTSVSHFDPKKARAIGLAATFRAEVVSATGSVVMPGAGDIHLALQDLECAQQTLLFGGIDAVRELSDDVQGILGQTFLSQFDYRIDVRGGRLQFGPSNGAGTRVPLLHVDGRPAIATSLGTLLLDSGAHRLVLFNIATTSVTRELMTVTGSVQAGTAPRELRINGRVFWRGDVVGVASTDLTIAGLLPVNLFKSVYINNSERYVVFD
jgi:hypothetical protein